MEVERDDFVGSGVLEAGVVLSLMAVCQGSNAYGSV